jgi:plasmid stabilization system protein ParE
MRTIHWNKLARLDYYDNIDFLLKEWSEKEAQEFIDEVFETEFILKQGNIDFQDTDRPDIKRCVIIKQISLFYRVMDEHNIELLRFWNNSQDDKKLKL